MPLLRRVLLPCLAALAGRSAALRYLCDPEKIFNRF